MSSAEDRNASLVVTPTTAAKQSRDGRSVTATSVNGHVTSGNGSSNSLTSPTSVTESRSEHLVTTASDNGRHVTNGTVIKPLETCCRPVSLASEEEEKDEDEEKEKEEEEEDVLQPTSSVEIETPDESCTERNTSGTSFAQRTQKETVDVTSSKALYLNNDRFAPGSVLTSDRGRVNLGFDEALTVSIRPYDKRYPGFKLSPRCFEMCDLSDPEALPKLPRSHEETGAGASDDRNCASGGERRSRKNKSYLGLAGRTRAELTESEPGKETLNDSLVERQDHPSNVAQKDTVSSHEDRSSDQEEAKDDKAQKSFKGLPRLSVRAGLRRWTRKRKRVYSVENSQRSITSSEKNVMCPRCSAWRHRANSTIKADIIMTDFPVRPVIYENQRHVCVRL